MWTAISHKRECHDNTKMPGDVYSYKDATLQRSGTKLLQFHILSFTVALRQGEKHKPEEQWGGHPWGSPGGCGLPQRGVQS